MLVSKHYARDLISKCSPDRSSRAGMHGARRVLGLALSKHGGGLPTASRALTRRLRVNKCEPTNHVAISGERGDGAANRARGISLPIRHRGQIVRVLSRSVLEIDGAVSGRMRIRGQAARSIGLSASFWFRVCHPSTLRMVI
jgi:hypothetical protein